MADETFDLRLYVAGQTPKAIRAFANLRKICDEHLAGRYSIEVIDLLEDPQLGRGDQILALPTLVRRLPEPIKKIIGDLSNTETRAGRAWIFVRDSGDRHGKADGTRRLARLEAAPGSRVRRALRASPVCHRHDAAVHPRDRERPRRSAKNISQGRYELEVIDIYQQPTLAKGEQIIAAPTLIKKLPLPLRRVIGDMSSTERVLLGLDLRPAR